MIRYSTTQRFRAVKRYGCWRVQRRHGRAWLTVALCESHADALRAATIYADRARVNEIFQRVVVGVK